MSTWKNKNIPQAKKNMCIAIVAARFNEEMVDVLIQNTKKGKYNLNKTVVKDRAVRKLPMV